MFASFNQEICWGKPHIFSIQECFNLSYLFLHLNTVKYNVSYQLPLTCADLNKQVNKQNLLGVDDLVITYNGCRVYNSVDDLFHSCILICQTGCQPSWSLARFEEKSRPL